MGWLADACIRTRIFFSFFTRACLQVVYKEGEAKMIHNLADWPDPATTPYYRVSAGWV